MNGMKLKDTNYNIFTSEMSQMFIFIFIVVLVVLLLMRKLKR